MNILSNYSKDTKTEKQVPGSYEWWYFDAQTPDGYKCVVIFYEGNPFSKRYIQALESGNSAKADQFPAISISVYKDDRPIYYSFREVSPGSAEFSSELPEGRVENNRFEGAGHQARLNYHLILNQKLPGGDAIRADLEFSTDLHSKPLIAETSSESESHEWNLVMPSCQVKGWIKVSGYHQENIEFNGLGYHDHNVGFEPLKESFTEWYWGRYHLRDSTFLYYLMNKKGKWEKRSWLIHKAGGGLAFDNIEMKNFELSVFGLNTARVIQANAEGDEIFLQLNETLDNGPFYQRFGGRLLLNSNGEVEEARGISEYIKPNRIYNKLFWPLVDMRISYPGKEHWVQKSPVLYRWTW